MTYRAVYQRMWDDPKFRRLRHGAEREVWFYLMTGHAASSLPGLQRLTPAGIADGADLPLADVEAALEALSTLGMVKVDRANRVVLLPNAPKYNPPANANMVIGWHKLWCELPESPLKVERLAALREAVVCHPWGPAAWAKTFGNSGGSAVSGGLVANRIETVSEPLPQSRATTDTDTDRETDTKEPSSGKPDAPPPPLGPNIDDDVTAVLGHWQARSGMAGASIEGPKAEKRRRRVKARLREGFTAEQLRQACDGAARDAFLMGTDPKARPGGHRDVDTWFRDGAQVERLIALATGTAPMPARAVSRPSPESRPPLPLYRPPPAVKPTPGAKARGLEALAPGLLAELRSPLPSPDRAADEGEAP